MAERLVIVSNRLPLTARPSPEGIALTRASGGLVTGLMPWHERSRGLWIGWPGNESRFTIDQRTQLDRELNRRRIVPVHLSREHIERYYNGFANRVLWPLFHYLIDRVPVDAEGWDAYQDVNRAFADVVAGEYRPGDSIWVHDYQLMLLPALLRARLPEARIGFFLHIPFPSSEVFRVLPWRCDILKGLLGADLVGFHTYSYMRHFLASLLHIDGLEADIDRVHTDDREVRLGVFPMGVDAARFSELARDPEVLAQADAIRGDAGDRRIILGVDRLDYTKGIPRRLHAMERLLQRYPSLSDQIRYIQVAVPTRGGVDSYQRFKLELEESVGRINGRYGTLRSTPVHYVHRSVSQRELVSLYLVADVMLVTPLRDGMNLVAKEFVASRNDEDGVLVLSEFAGAAAELDGAIVVNPYNIDDVAECIRNALSMGTGERRARMRLLRRRVTDFDVHAWAAGFLENLRSARLPEDSLESSGPGQNLVTVLIRAVRAAPVRLLLDYDGTLVPIRSAADQVKPDAELLALITNLTTIPRVSVDIVSGRPRESLETWFGTLPIGLWAEHGFWRRRSGGDTWLPAAPVDPGWMERLLPILNQFTACTPGSHVELKTASVAWHYRGAQREFGARQAHELRMLLGDTLSNQPLEVLEGRKVIEIRFRGISKALVARDPVPPDTITIAFGDDRTDEDLFRALPSSSIAVSVGRSLVGARYLVRDHRAVRDILRQLLSDAVEPDCSTR